MKVAFLLAETFKRKDKKVNVEEAHQLSRNDGNVHVNSQHQYGLLPSQRKPFQWQFHPFPGNTFEFGKD